MFDMEDELPIAHDDFPIDTWTNLTDHIVDGKVIDCWCEPKVRRIEPGVIYKGIMGPLKLVLHQPHFRSQGFRMDVMDVMWDRYLFRTLDDIGAGRWKSTTESVNHVLHDIFRRKGPESDA